MDSMTRGYYSIIQFCPDPSRLETVNLGVALYCPEIGYLRARLGRRKTPVSQVFGRRDWAFIEAQKVALESRLNSSSHEFQCPDGFAVFAAKRAGALRMTKPRPLKASDPEQELESLFSRLVGRQQPAMRSLETLFEAQLGSRFQAAGIEAKLSRNVTVHPPSLPKPIRVPYAFQNGHFNLIEPLQFEGQSLSSVFNKASVHAVEGEFLSEYEDPERGALRLIVVANFGPGQASEQRAASSVF